MPRMSNGGRKWIDGCVSVFQGHVTCTGDLRQAAAAATVECRQVEQPANTETIPEPGGDPSLPGPDPSLSELLNYRTGDCPGALEIPLTPLIDV